MVLVVWCLEQQLQYLRELIRNATFWIPYQTYVSETLGVESRNLFEQAFQVILVQANLLGHTSSQHVYGVEHGEQLSAIFTEARAQGKYI